MGRTRGKFTNKVIYIENSGLQPIGGQYLQNVNGQLYWNGELITTNTQSNTYSYREFDHFTDVFSTGWWGYSLLHYFNTTATGSSTNGFFTNTGVAEPKSYPSHPGVIRLNAGGLGSSDPLSTSLISCQCCLIHKSNSFANYITNVSIKMEALVRFNSFDLLSEDYKIAFKIGIRHDDNSYNSLTPRINEGIEFRMDTFDFEGYTAGTLYAVNSEGSESQSLFPVVQGDWYKLGIVVDTDNNTQKFYVNEVLVAEFNEDLTDIPLTPWFTVWNYETVTAMAIPHQLDVDYSSIEFYKEQTNTLYLI